MYPRLRSGTTRVLDITIEFILLSFADKEMEQDDEPDEQKNATSQLQILKNLFPKKSEETLRMKLAEVGYNTLKAIEKLTPASSTSTTAFATDKHEKTSASSVETPRSRSNSQSPHSSASSFDSSPPPKSPQPNLMSTARGFYLNQPPQIVMPKFGDNPFFRSAFAPFPGGHSPAPLAPLPGPHPYALAPFSVANTHGLLNPMAYPSASVMLQSYNANPASFQLSPRFGLANSFLCEKKYESMNK